MKKVFVLLILCVSLFKVSFATHQRAAEITYRHLQGLTFEFTITMYTRTSSPADDTRTFMPIFWGDESGSEIERIEWYEIPGVPDVSYNLYKGTHTFPAPGTYVISVEDPNRNGGVVNIPNSINVPMFIQSSVVINPFLGVNNSVQLLTPPIDQGCVGQRYIHNPGAYDPDGDSLAFKLVPCKGAGGYDIPGYTYPKTQPGGYFGIDSVSGDLLWETPVLQGEYNVAFVVEEWRHGILVGTVRRDMQIEIVACDHVPPEIYTITDTCVVAGDFLQFDAAAVDPDGTAVTLTAYGGPFEQTENPAYLDPDPAVGIDTAKTTFNWPTNCSHVRLEPFTVVFKAQDKGLPVPLVNFKTVFVSVNAPAPENLQAEALGNGVNLNWEKSPCENAIGYRIYRRSGESGWEPGICETGVPAYTGYIQIAEVNGVNTLTFRDDNLGVGLVHGINYCYRVTAFFIDDAESIASNEACAYLKRDVPIITHVSNDSTAFVKGNALVIWSKPTELDTLQYPGPYKYVLYRNNGLVWNTPVEVADFQGLNDTIFLDESINMNTNDKPYSYRVDLESLTVGFIGSSQKASAVFIRTMPSDQEIILEWFPDVPWQNDQFIIYRKSPGEDTYDSLDITNIALYRDTGLENGKTYCYIVKAIGHYSLPGLVDPLINFSQIACQDPTDNVPPCQPVLTIETNCEEVTNILTWTLPYDSCKQDVAEYQVFYAPSKGEPLDLIETIINPYDTTFSHANLTNVVGCYAVTAIDSVGNVSDTSNIVCVNYDACPPYELPNVFTPNGDSYNDLFVPITDVSGNPKANVDRVDMSIFNRWGKIMYTTTDPQINWDGKNQNNNEDCADGVYFYVCEVYIITLTGEESFTLKGSVSIYRGE